eukprot:TRINITY_DN6337_c0_g1_i3.p1 TRINITY_DN6337_c0_g1~~TRINITY_DN6337_c0_g1_i3.p1  ORF type:complete len:221 (-),score=22.05 TRINITY_DN6337_c0_g1_i3:180-842(-)
MGPAHETDEEDELLAAQRPIDSDSPRVPNSEETALGKHQKVPKQDGKARKRERKARDSEASLERVGRLVARERTGSVGSAVAGSREVEVEDGDEVRLGSAGQSVTRGTRVAPRSLPTCPVYVFDMKNVVIAGETKVEAWDQDVGPDDDMFHFWLHPALIPPSLTLRLGKTEIDGAHKHSSFDPHFQVELFFSLMGDEEELDIIRTPSLHNDLNEPLIRKS